MANSYKNIVITPNTGSTVSDPSIVFAGGDSNTNTDIILRVYPTLSGTLSFEGSSGQLFSITNDLTNTIFSVNDISGLPMIEVNTTSQIISLGQFYGNVCIGNITSTIYELDVAGPVNASSYVINGVLSSGLRNVNYQTANYILSLTDVGKLVVANSPNVFVTGSVFSAGQNIEIYNNTAANITVTQNTGVTMFLSGTATTGNRTLAQRGYATLTCVVGSNTFVISGSGLT